MYNAALYDAGYAEWANYDGKIHENKPSRNRKHKVIWYNHPYNKSVFTIIGRVLNNQLDKHFYINIAICQGSIDERAPGNKLKVLNSLRFEPRPSAYRADADRLSYDVSRQFPNFHPFKLHISNSFRHIHSP